MLYTNLYNAIYQLYCNKTGEGRRHECRLAASSTVGCAAAVKEGPGGARVVRSMDTPDPGRSGNSLVTVLELKAAGAVLRVPDTAVCFT